MIGNLISVLLCGVILSIISSTITEAGFTFTIIVSGTIVEFAILFAYLTSPIRKEIKDEVTREFHKIGSGLIIVGLFMWITGLFMNMYNMFVLNN